jgi:hypothetical protein
MIATTSAGYQTLSQVRRKNVWFTLRAGNWNDPTIWSGNGTKDKRLVTNEYIRSIPEFARYYTGVNPTTIRNTYVAGTPRVGDIVYIYHDVDITMATEGINSLLLLDSVYVASNAKLRTTNGSGTFIQIMNNFICDGTFEQTVSTQSLLLAGLNNKIGTYIGVGNSSITYNRFGDQDIVTNITYKSLIVTNNGTKRIYGDLNVESALTTNGTLLGGITDVSFPLSRTWLDIGEYNLTVTGTTSIGDNSYLKKHSATGRMLFIGLLLFNGSGTTWGLPDFNGNIEFECRGGLIHTHAAAAYGGTYNFGTGKLSFTTNNQTVRHDIGPIIYNCYIEIASGLTITATQAGRWQINNDIEGLSTGTTLDNRGYIGYAGVTPMNTGITRCDIASNTFEYNGINQDVKDITYWNLRVTERAENTAGSHGTKTALNHITCIGTLYVSASIATTNRLDLGVYNLTVGGRTDIVNGLLTKTGSGNVLFGGVLFFNGSGSGARVAGLDFSAGNPTVEMRGGIDTGNFIGSEPLTKFRTGTNTWRFTTNNQQIARNNSTSMFALECVVQIEDIVLSVWNGIGGGTRFTGVINGTTAGSTFRVGRSGETTVNRRTSNVIFDNDTTPMLTGVLDCTTADYSNAIFISTGATTIPNVQYSRLTIGGGTKTIPSGLTIFELTVGYTLSDMIQTTLSNRAGTHDLLDKNLNIVRDGLNLVLGTLTKTSGGTITISGSTLFNSGSLDLSGGNPTVELRGGINFVSSAGTLNTGTGNWYFTNRNQTISNTGGGVNRTFSGNIIVSGVTVSGGTATAPLTFDGSLDGTDSSSIWIAQGITYYQNAIAPMVTGKLYANQNSTNTFRYSRAGNQDITVPQDPTNPGYRNLILETSGAKRLLGNVSVKGTYTLTAPATLDLNGFTLTNP